MPSPTKRFFLSDLHLGMNQPTDWYKPEKHKDAVLAAIQFIAQQKAVKDLVLLGDIFDTWNIPVTSAEVYSVRDIIESGIHKEIWEAIAACCKDNVSIYYVNGNHDMETTQEDLDLLRKKHKVSVRWVPRYQGGLLYAEHGSRFAMFNAPDRLHDPAGGLPLGYFITRILAGDPDYTSFHALASYIDDALEAVFTTHTVSSCVLEAVMERHNHVFPDHPISETTTVVMPNRRSPVALADVKQRYADLFELWSQKFGYQYCINSIRAELGSLGWFADRLCSSQGYKAVVLGHTHDPDHAKHWRFFDKWLYLNTGKLCSDEPTFGEVDKAKNQFQTTLWQIAKKNKGLTTVQIGKSNSVSK